MNNKSLNSNLNKAKSKGADDQYTQRIDIEKELKHYKKHFKNKIVYCNCDDPRISNFFYYFSYKFEELGLKKLITSCYKNQNIDLFSFNDQKQAINLEYKGDMNGNKIPDIEEIGINYFKGDGDFRNDESIKLLKEADIVVTNPPFSLIEEYISQLVKYKKKFLIMGDQNHISYKEIFSLIRKNKLWLGVDNGGNKWFEVREHYNIKTEARKKIVNGKKYFSMGRICWFTNLEHNKRNEDLILYKTYNPKDHPKYDHYDAIFLDTVANIPKDYPGAMAVPLTFLDKFNPKQFEILNSNDLRLNDLVPFKKHGLIKDKDGSINGKAKYIRIVIKNKRL